MPLTVSEKNKKRHYYFTVGGSKKLYLGGPNKPNEKNIKEAEIYLHNKIRKYEGELHTINSLLPGTGHDHPLKYKLVVFDLDGVIYDKPWHDAINEKVAVSTWDILFKELGYYSVHERFRSQFEEGTFKSYTEWTDAACSFLRSIRLDRRRFEDIIVRRPLVDGAAEVLQTLWKNEVVIAIITGSFDALAQRVKKIVPVRDVFAHCKLSFGKDEFLKSWKLTPSDYEDKANFVRQLGERYNIPKDQRAYIGDDINDRAAFEEVGLSIAFNCDKPKVRQAAKVVIEGRNLEAVLRHLYDYDSEAPAAEPPKAMCAAPIQALGRPLGTSAHT